MQYPTYISVCFCLIALNENSREISDLILQQLQTPVHTYLSTERVVTDNPKEAAAYTMEFLNTQTPSGLPKHKLEVKVEPSKLLLRKNFLYVFSMRVLQLQSFPSML